MRIEVKSPTLPESVTEATLLSWHKQTGDPVSRDENLVDIETEKVVLEVPAPQTGVLKEVLKGEGETVGSGEPIAVIETGEASATGKGGAEQPKAVSATQADEAGATRGPSAGTPSPAPAPSAPEAGDAAEGAAKQSQTVRPTQADKASAAPRAAEPGDGELSLGPAVRRLLQEHGLDPAKIPATGKGGRLTKEDVQAYLRAREQEQAGVTPKPSAAQPPPATPVPAAPVPAASAVRAPSAPEAGDTRGERRVPMTRLRATIAERLLHAQRAAALLTTFNEVNMQAVMDLRGRYRERFEEAHKVRLGFMSFFVKAAVQALQQYPIVNASVDGRDIVYHDYYDIGIAVAGPRGLVVPVLRDADQMSFAEVELRIAEFARKAAEGTLSMEDLAGGTFTITNGGIFGSLVSTPLVNPPQSAILGMHKIQQRPVAEDNEVRIRPMMYLALTYDHRIIDGREAVQFLVRLKEALEDPARLLLHI